MYIYAWRSDFDSTKLQSRDNYSKPRVFLYGTCHLCPDRVFCGGLPNIGTGQGPWSGSGPYGAIGPR